jgi:hypothetical protein
MRKTLLGPLGTLLALALSPAGSPRATESAAAPVVPPSVNYTPWRYQADYPLPEVPEPSGLCFVPARGTLFVVDDGAPDRPCGVYELTLEAKVLQRREVGRDLEGICYCPVDGLLYLSDEAGDKVWIVEPEGLQVRGSCTIALEQHGQQLLRPGGNSFEGIEYIPSSQGTPRDYFLLLNQDDPSALVRVERADLVPNRADPVPLTSFHRLPDLNCGELYYDQAAQQLWVVHSWLNLYEVLDIDTLAVRDWQVCPGVAQEGLCFDGQGRLWIGSDSGGIAVYAR